MRMHFGNPFTSKRKKSIIRRIRIQKSTEKKEKKKQEIQHQTRKHLEINIPAKEKKSNIR